MKLQILKKKDIFPNEPYFIHTFNSKKNASFSRHSHDYFEIILVVSGHLQQLIEGRKSVLGPGSLCFFTPETEHSIEGKSREENFHMVNLAIDAQSGKSLMSASGEAGAAAFTKAQHPEASRDPGRLAEEMLTAGSLSRGPSAQAQLLRLWGSLLIAAQPRSQSLPQGENLPPAWLSLALQQLEEGPEMPSLELLQKQSGRSREHIGRSLRKYYGVSSSFQVNQIRLQRARQILESTDRQIIEIALECGFGNLSYFNKLFKGTFKKNPRDWRKSRATVLGA